MPTMLHAAMMLNFRRCLLDDSSLSAPGLTHLRNSLSLELVEQQHSDVGCTKTVACRSVRELETDAYVASPSTPRLSRARRFPGLVCRSLLPKSKR